MSKEYVLHRLRRRFASVDVQGGTGGVSQQDFDALKAKVQTNEQHLNQNDGKIVVAETDIANLKTGKANDNEVVKLTGNQDNINGNKTFKGNLTTGTRIELGYGGSDIVITAQGSSLKSCTISNLQFNFAGNRTGSQPIWNLNMDGITNNNDIPILKLHFGGEKGKIFWRKNSPEWINITGKWEWAGGSLIQFRGGAKSFTSPSANEDIANKKYVDDVKNALKTEIKDKFANANDFAALKAAIAAW